MNGMKRLWILFKTEFNAWRHDPITSAGGIIPPSLILIAFGLLFGGRLLFPIGVINQDTGVYGDILVETLAEVQSPFGIPYYEVAETEETAVWQAYNAYRLEGVWVIPPDFSARLEAGNSPSFEMYFNNYNDDRAKNHRIYSAEIIWVFYKKIGLPGPPLEVAEQYPRSEMVHWFPIISVGVTVMAATLGGIFNIFVLTYKEKMSRVTLEFALMPRSLLWVLLPKTVLALLFSLVTGTFFLIVLYFWLGVWAGRYLWLVWLLLGCVGLYWIGLALLFGLGVRNYMAGAITAVLTAIIIFFIGGGLSMVRINADKVIKIAWLFPNTYAVDPLRDMILFHTWPVDGTRSLLVLVGMALTAITLSWLSASRWLRHGAT
jgi:ABC-2 type transport system permease protein